MFSGPWTDLAPPHGLGGIGAGTWLFFACPPHLPEGHENKTRRVSKVSAREASF